MSEVQQPPRNTEYLEQRLAALDITEKQNTFTRVWFQDSSAKDDDGNTHTTNHRYEKNYKLFDADEDGNIVIRYFNLDGQPYRWKKEGTAMTRDFIRKRLKEPKGDMKYSQESGSPQVPFFNPELIARFQLAKQIQREIAEGKEPSSPADDGVIHTLFVVEGEFKSRAGQLAGIDIIGLPSIHGFYNGDVKGKLHEDIQELIVTCQVQKIVFLVDADLLSVKWAENKDLATRPANFYGSIKAFRESIQLLLDDEKVALELPYFMHISSKFMNDAKGLDDLLCKYTAKREEILADLYSLAVARKYFSGFPMLDQNKDVQGRIYRYLGLTDETEFYKTYGEDFIGAREFKFRRRRYVYNQEQKEVVFVRHEDAAKFMRIGPSWVKVILRVNSIGQVEQEIKKWNVAEIQRDYKKYPDFLEQIQKYDAFCSDPAWAGNYKRVVNNCYNLCDPITWDPGRGSIQHTAAFLKHLFQGQGNIELDADGLPLNETNIQGDPFTVALDWLTIIIQHPKEPLPVPILVSPENRTGKSTFLKWLTYLFGTNAVILGNEQFKMKFNAHYITKFIIGIDESFLEVDKKAEKERLKQMVTADSVYLEYKGMDVNKIDYYGKLVMCSNDADRVMKIDEGESRWFIVRVPVLASEDPLLREKLIAELPAWLHYVQTRSISHKKESRLWFRPEWFITDQMRLIVETTKNRMDRVFEDWIREQFTIYRLSQLKYSISQLADYFNDFRNNKYKIDKIELRAYLQQKSVPYDKRPQRFQVPTGIDIPQDNRIDTKVIMEQCNPTTVYIFHVDKWLKPEEIDALLPFTDPVSLTMKPVGSAPQAAIVFNNPWDGGEQAQGAPGPQKPTTDDEQPF